MTWRKAVLILVVGLLAVIALLWLARARIAAEFAAAYFRNHGVTSSVEIGDLGLSGASGRFALGPADAPDIAADRIELHFDPLSWIPRVVEVRLVGPVIRARVDDHGTVTLPSLQDWITSLQQQQGKSRFVSDDLAVSLTGLRALLTTPAGALELDGDVKLVKNLPVSVTLTARPAALAWQGVSVRLAAASLSYVPGQARLHLSGAGAGRGIILQKFDADASASDLAWSASSIRMSALALKLSAATAQSDAMAQADLRNVSLSSEGFSAGLRLTASVHAGRDMLRLPPTGDAALDRALAANLSRVNVTMAADLSQRSGRSRFQLTAPLQVTGEHGARLSVPELTAAQDQNGAAVQLRAGLSGGGLPNLDIVSRNILVSPKGFSGGFALNAHFNYAMLRDARIRADTAQVSWQDGQLRVQTSNCARITLAAFKVSLKQAPAKKAGAWKTPKQMRGLAFTGAHRRPGAAGGTNQARRDTVRHDRPLLLCIGRAADAVGDLAQKHTVSSANGHPFHLNRGRARTKVVELSTRANVPAHTHTQVTQASRRNGRVSANVPDSLGLCEPPFAAQVYHERLLLLAQLDGIRQLERRGTGQLNWHDRRLARHAHAQRARVHERNRGSPARASAARPDRVSGRACRRCQRACAPQRPPPAGAPQGSVSQQPRSPYRRTTRS